MSAQQDFERAWLAKFSSCLDKVVGEKVRKEVMRGSDDLSSLSSRQEVIGWSKGAMERLDSLVDEEQAQETMTGCACQYPKSALQAVRERYKVTGDIDSAHQMLQEQFESLLRDSLQLSDGLVEEIVKRGWGSAGIEQGNTIIATKIPNHLCSGQSILQNRRAHRGWVQRGQRFATSTDLSFLPGWPCNVAVPSIARHD